MRCKIEITNPILKELVAALNKDINSPTDLNIFSGDASLYLVTPYHNGVLVTYNVTDEGFYTKENEFIPLDKAEQWVSVPIIPDPVPVVESSEPVAVEDTNPIPPPIPLDSVSTNVNEKVKFVSVASTVKKTLSYKDGKEHFSDNPQNRFMETIYTHLQQLPSDELGQYSYVMVEDNYDNYAGGPLREDGQGGFEVITREEFKAIQGQVLFLVKGYKKGMTLNEVKEAVPTFARHQNKPYPIPTEFKYGDLNIDETSIGNRVHEERIATHAEKFKKTIQAAKEFFMKEFKVMQSIARNTIGNRYTPLGLGSISFGNIGLKNSRQEPWLDTLKEKFLNFKVLEEGYVSVEFIEDMSGFSDNLSEVTTSIIAVPKEMSTVEKKDINTVFNGMMDSEGYIDNAIIPFLILMFGRKITPKQNSLTMYSEGNNVYTLSYYNNDKKQLASIRTNTKYENKIELNNFLTVIEKELKRNISINLANDTSPDVTVGEYLDGIDFGNNQFDVDGKVYSRILKELFIDENQSIKEYIFNNTYPSRTPNYYLNDSNEEVATYLPGNRYSYINYGSLSAPVNTVEDTSVVQSVKVERDEFSNFIDEKFAESESRTFYLEDLTEAEIIKLENEHFVELQLSNGKFREVNLGIDIYITRESTAEVILEEKVHALTRNWLEKSNDGTLRSVIADLRKELTERDLWTPKWEDTIGKTGIITVRHEAELLGRAVSDKELRADIMNIELKGDAKTVFDMIVDAFNNIINKILGKEGEAPNYYNLLVKKNVEIINSPQSESNEYPDMDAFFSFQASDVQPTMRDIKDALDINFIYYYTQGFLGEYSPELFRRGMRTSDPVVVKFINDIFSFKFPRLNQLINNGLTRDAVNQWLSSSIRLTFVEFEDNQDTINSGKERGADTAFERSSNKFTLRELTANSIRTIMSILPKVHREGDNKGKKVINIRTGISEPAFVSEVMVDIYKDLSGILDEEVIITKMKELAKTNAMYATLNAVLGINEGGTVKKDLFYSLINTLLTFELPVIKTRQFENGHASFEETGNNRQNIVRVWNSNFKEIQEDRFKLDRNKELIPTKEYAVELHRAILDKDKLKVLELLGVKLSREQFPSSALFIATVNKVNLTVIKNRLKNYKGFSNNGTQILNTPWNSLFTEKSDTEILKTESNLSTIRSNIMVPNTENDKVNHYSLPNTALIMTNLFDQFSQMALQMGDGVTYEGINETIFNMMKNINSPEFRATEAYRYLMGGSSGKVGRIELISVDGYQDEDIKLTTTKLGASPWLKQQLYLWQDKKSIEFLRTETGSSSWGYRILDHRGIPYNPISNRNPFDTAVIRYEEYFNGFIDQLNTLDDPTYFPFKGNKEGFSQFGIFEFLDEETKNSILDSPSKELWKQVEPQVIAHLSEVRQEAVKLYNNYRLLETGEGRNRITSDMIKNFALSYKLHSINSTFLMYGNVKWTAAFFKRAKLIVSPGTTTPLSLPYYEQTSPEMSKIFNINSELNTQVKVNSIKDTVRGVRNTKFKSDVMKSAASFIKNRRIPVKFQKVFKSLIKEGLNNYDSFEATDGQSYTSLDLARMMLQGRNNWSEELEVAYQYEVAFLKEKMGYALTEKQTELLKTKYTGARFQSYKWQYSGPIKEHEKFNPIISMKTAFGALVPSEVWGTELWNPMVNMLKNNTHILTHESSMKSAIATEGATAPIDIQNFSEGQEDNRFTIFTPYLKEQVKTDNGIKETNVLATQFVKLLFSDALVPIYKAGVYDRLEWLPKAEDLFNDYLKILQRIVDIEKVYLYQDLDISENEGIIEVKSPEKLVNALTNQLKLQDNDDIDLYNILDHLKETGGNFDAVNVGELLNTVLSGILNKRIGKIKLPGNVLTLISSSYYDESLKFYGYNENGTSKAETKIALQGNFINLLNREDVLLQANSDLREDRKLTVEDKRIALNRLIREGRIDENLITVFGYRIPTSGLNLMDVYVIKEFMPESFGSRIMVPIESVVKVGEDFDADKKNFYFPTITDKGELMTQEYIDNLKTSPEKLEEEITLIDEELNESASDFQDLKDSLEEVKDQISTYKGKRTPLLESLKLIGELQKQVDSFVEIRKVEKALKAKFKKKEITKNAFHNRLKEVRESNPVYAVALEALKNAQLAITKEQMEEFKTLTKSLEGSYEVKKSVYEFFDYFNDLKKRRSQLKGYRKFQIGVQTNKLIDVAVGAMLLPERFFQLVSPVSTDFLKQYFKESSDIKFDKVTNIESSLQKRIDMVTSGQKLTGLTAKASTLLQLLTRAGFKINKMAKNLPIIFPMIKGKQLKEIKKREYWDFSNTLTMDGILKSELLNQLTQATLDAAKKSLLGINNLGPSTLPIAQYLAAMVGLPIEFVRDFIAQPSIVEKAKLRGSGFSSRDATIAMVERISERAEFGFRYLNQSLKGNSVDYKTLLKDIESTFGNEYNNTPKKNTKEWYLNQLYALYLFDIYEKHNKAIREIDMAINADTNPDVNVIQAYSRKLARKRVISTGFLVEDSLDKVLNDSEISSKFISDLIISVVGKMTPIKSNPFFLAEMVEFGYERNWNRAKRETYERLIMNDLMDWVIKSNVNIKGKPFNVKFQEVANVENKFYKKFKTYVQKNNLEYLDYFIRQGETVDGMLRMSMMGEARIGGWKEAIQKDLFYIKNNNPDMYLDIQVLVLGTYGFRRSFESWTDMLPSVDLYKLIEKDVSAYAKTIEDGMIAPSEALRFIHDWENQPDNKNFLRRNPKKARHAPKFVQVLNSNKIDKTVSVTKSFYTRKNVREDANTIYVFTENAYSIENFPTRQGGGSAIIRPELNAFGIVTKKKYDYNTRENVDYQDTHEDFMEFTTVNNVLFQKIKDDARETIVFPKGFASDKAKLPTRFAEWLQERLLEEFGLMTKLNSTGTGLRSIGVSDTAEISESTEIFRDKVIANMRKAMKGKPAAKHLAKEILKVKKATKFIGQGIGSTNSHRISWDTRANVTEYTSDDVVMLAANGKRNDRFKPVVDGVLQGNYVLIDSAIAAGADFVADTAEHLSKSNYNIGELELTAYLKSKGLTRTTIDGVGYWTNSNEPIAKTDTIRQKKLADLGVLHLPDTQLGLEQSVNFINLLQPIIKSQAYVENKAATANKMFSVGLRWSRVNQDSISEGDKRRVNNKEAATFGIKPNRVAINQKEDRAYGYFTHDQNGIKLPSIETLAPIITYLESKLGIDMSGYDAMLGNIYENGSFIHQHRDTTESITAEGYPVIVINLGANGELVYDKNLRSNYSTFRGNGSLELSNGGIYAFGVKGKNRFTFHHRIASTLNSKTLTPPVSLSDGTVLKDYRITLTFRRAKDLEAGMPSTPTMTSTTDTSNESESKSVPFTSYNESIQVDNNTVVEIDTNSFPYEAVMSRNNEEVGFIKFEITGEGILGDEMVSYKKREGIATQLKKTLENHYGLNFVTPGQLSSEGKFFFNVEEQVDSNFSPIQLSDDLKSEYYDRLIEGELDTNIINDIISRNNVNFTPVYTNGLGESVGLYHTANPNFNQLQGNLESAKVVLRKDNSVVELNSGVGTFTLENLGIQIREDSEEVIQKDKNPFGFSEDQINEIKDCN